MKRFMYADAKQIIENCKSNDTQVKNDLWNLVFSESSADTQYEDPKIHDLLVELYLFISDGDLRKKGRDVGFSSIEDFTNWLENIQKSGSQTE